MALRSRPDQIEGLSGKQQVHQKWESGGGCSPIHIGGDQLALLISRVNDRSVDGDKTLKLTCHDPGVQSRWELLTRNQKIS